MEKMEPELVLDGGGADDDGLVTEMGGGEGLGEVPR